MLYKIYLVEDEQTLNEILVHYLQAEGYEVTSFLDGKTAQAQIKDEPDLWVLDIFLPDISGHDLIKLIREHNKYIPVIFMSARNKEFDRVIGFKLGASDYISKSFDPQELIFRIKMVMEREHNRKSKKDGEYILVNGYEVYEAEHRIVYDTTEIELTYNEFELFMILVKNRNKLVSRKQILKEIWDEYYVGSNNVIDNTMQRLRRKMEHLQIETSYGAGYRLVAKQ